MLEISTEKRTGVGKIFKDTEAKKQPAYLVSFKTGLMLEWKMNLFSNTVSVYFQNELCPLKLSRFGELSGIIAKAAVCRCSMNKLV